MRTSRRVAGLALGVAGLVVLVAGPAAAHVQPDPNQVKPGKLATVEFSPEHGCKGSPTTRMSFLVPKGVTGAKPVKKDGWKSKVAGRTITFSGGSAPGDQPSVFVITFTAPKTKTLLTWKVVQACEQGVERWIEGPKGENPAPVVGVGKAPPTVIVKGE